MVNLIKDQFNSLFGVIDHYAPPRCTEVPLSNGLVTRVCTYVSGLTGVTPLPPRKIEIYKRLGIGCLTRVFNQNYLHSLMHDCTYIYT